MSNQDKADELMRIEGLSEDDLHQLILDSVSPAICMNPDCDYTTEMEPDQDKGWCEVCETNTVKSLFVLLNII